jgi:hypothetical protein
VEIWARPQFIELAVVSFVFLGLLADVIVKQGVWYEPWLMLTTYYCLGYFAGFRPGLRTAVQALHEMGLTQGDGQRKGARPGAVEQQDAADGAGKMERRS